MEAHGEMQENERQSGTVRKTEDTDVHTGNARSDANRLTTDRHNARKLASHTRDNDGDFNGRSTANIETDINTTVNSNTDIVNTRNGMDLLSEPLVDHRVTANISDLTMTSAAYKKVANKVRPVPTTLPEEFRIVRRAHPNPLENMPVLPTHPPEFSPGRRFTRERYDALDIDPTGFLWPEERKLAYEFIKLHEECFAWNEQEKGTFSNEYFDPILIPTVEHIPWVHRNIPIAPGHYKEVIEIIKGKIDSGIYEPSNSSYRSRWFCVKKKDGKLRFVQDYRKLNQFTVKNRYPLPLVVDIISRLQGARYFTKFDVRWGYNNIRIKQGDEWKAAFATNRGLFEPSVMFFGLTNSPATFQALMNSIFTDLIASGKVAVYLDNILIFSSQLEELQKVVQEVLA